MKSFTFVFIFLFIFSLSFAQEKSWEATYKEAELFAQRRNFKAAISVFETALNLAERSLVNQMKNI